MQVYVCMLHLKCSSSIPLNGCIKFDYLVSFRWMLRLSLLSYSSVPVLIHFWDEQSCSTLLPHVLTSCTGKARHHCCALLSRLLASLALSWFYGLPGCRTAIRGSPFSLWLVSSETARSYSFFNQLWCRSTSARQTSVLKWLHICMVLLCGRPPTGADTMLTCGIGVRSGPLAVIVYKVLKKKTQTNQKLGKLRTQVTEVI